MDTREAGAKGGAAKVKKGLAKVSKKRRKEIATAAVNARWAKYRAAKQAEGNKKK